MILEMASLLIRPGTQAAFEQVFDKAIRLIEGQSGYLSHELRRSVERDGHYALLIEWHTLEDHTRGFRQSNEFQRWREMLGDYLMAPPEVEHFHPARRPGQRAGHAAD